MAQLPATPDGKTRMFRMGTFFWSLGTDASAEDLDPQAHVQRLVSQLAADPRVTHVASTDDEDDYQISLETFYPATVANFEAMMFGSDAMDALEFTPALIFSVQVPIKNQPLRDGIDDVPSDSYWAAWNGVTLAVMWSQDDDDVPMSGGHIVIDVLRDAIGAAGGELVNQACSSGCKFQFLHPTMLVAPADQDELSDGTHIAISPRRPLGLESYEVSLPSVDDDHDALTWLALTVMRTANEFASMKSLGNRVLSIESAAREQLSHAIIHEYESAQIASIPVHRRLSATWKNRGSRRETRRLVSSLLLCVANLETLLRSWEDLKRDFEDASAQGAQDLLFRTDAARDIARIESMKLDHLETAVEQLGDSLNNRAMIGATVNAALAGGLAGGLIGAASTLLS